LNELAGDPVREVFGIWRGEPEDDVSEAGVDGLRDRALGRGGPVVGNREMDRAGDRGWIPADLSTELVQQSASPNAVVDVAAGDVPKIGVLGDDAQRRRCAPADDDRRTRPLDGFGIAERSGQTDVGALEVERLGLRPQTPDDRARLGEASDSVGEVVEGQAVRRVFAPRRRRVWPVSAYLQTRRMSR
jgi:hypothetical protein